MSSEPHSQFGAPSARYEFLEDFATADIAFVATGSDVEAVFRASADATINVMVENPEAVEPREVRPISIEHAELDLLLFDFLQELIFYKDSETLLLRVHDLSIKQAHETYSLEGSLAGERLDPNRHEQRADVKAVTLHQFKLEKTRDGEWRAQVILDI